MAIITPPGTLPVREDSWNIITPAQVNTSRWTGSRQVQLLPGARWECQASLAPIVNESLRKQWRAFFASLRGVANQFKVYPEPSNQTPNANPTVSGAGQTGYQLVVASGLEGNLLVQEGDWMTIPLPTKGEQLVMVTDSNLVVGGVTTITFTPLLREAPANAAVVQIQNPYAVVSMKNPSFSFSRDIMLNHGITLDLEETW